jgi:hypothetical protein
MDTIKNKAFLKRAAIFYYVVWYNDQTDEAMLFDTESLSDSSVKQAKTKGFQEATKAEFETALDFRTAQIAYNVAINNEILRECMEMKELLSEGGKARRFRRV